MEANHGSAAILNIAKRHAVVLWKVIEQLERVRKACTKDSRPKTVEGLKNTMSPLCKVIFFRDIAKTLRNAHEKSKGYILMKQMVMSEMAFTVNELLEKIWKSVVAIARKQRREVLMAQTYTEPFKAIHNQLKKWKQSYKSQTQVYGDLISALVDACIFKVDLANADSVIDLLKKSSIVDIDAAGKVKYVFPDEDALEAAVSGFQSQCTSAWSNKIDVWKFTYPNEHLLQGSDDEMETDDILDELTVRVIVHLQKMKNHLPKTEKGLRNAVAPLLSLMYVASPKSFLESLIERSHAESVRNPRKRSWRTHKQKAEIHSDVEKVVFKHRRKETNVKQVALNQVIHGIGSVLGEKNMKASGPCKKSLPRAFGVCEAKKAPGQLKPGCYVLLKLLEDVQQKGQYLNRSVIFLSSEDDPEVVGEGEITKWLQANAILPKGQVSLCGPSPGEKVGTETTMEDDSVSIDGGCISKESAHVNSNSMFATMQTGNTCVPSPMSAAEMLASLKSLSSHIGNIDPAHVVSMLTQAGYCTVQDRLVSYPDSFPTTTYQESLKALFTHIIKELDSSFVQGHVEKPTNFSFAKTKGKGKQRKSQVIKHLKNLRKRPKYL